MSQWRGVWVLTRNCISQMAEKQKLSFWHFSVSQTLVKRGKKPGTCQRNIGSLLPAFNPVWKLPKPSMSGVTLNVALIWPDSSKVLRSVDSHVLLMIQGRQERLLMQNVCAFNVPANMPVVLHLPLEARSVNCTSQVYQRDICKSDSHHLCEQKWLNHWPTELNSYVFATCLL